MYWERVMRRKEREKRSPPARITLWRQVGHCSLSWNVFIWLFPLVGGPASRRFHPSIPVVNPSGRIDKSCYLIVCWCSKGNGVVGLEGPSEEGLLTAVFHNVGSTTSLLTQNKALSYGFARRLSYGFGLLRLSADSRSGVTNAVGSHCF
jgi:hypothetical protein